MYGYMGDNWIHNENEILQLYIKISTIKYIVYVLHKIKSSQNTFDRNTPHWSCKEYEKLTCWVEVTTIKDWHK